MARATASMTASGSAGCEWPSSRWQAAANAAAEASGSRPVGAAGAGPGLFRAGATSEASAGCAGPAIKLPSSQPARAMARSAPPPVRRRASQLRDSLTLRGRPGAGTARRFRVWRDMGLRGGGDVVERGGAKGAVVVTGDGQADADVGGHGDGLGADLRPGGTVGGAIGREGVAATDDLDPARSRAAGLGRERTAPAGAGSALEGGAVAGRKEERATGGIVVQRFADHHAGFGPRVRVLDAVHARDDGTIAAGGLIGVLAG